MLESSDVFENWLTRYFGILGGHADVASLWILSGFGWGFAVLKNFSRSFCVTRPSDCFGDDFQPANRNVPNVFGTWKFGCGVYVGCQAR